MLGMILSNPLRSAGIVVIISGIIIMGLLTWRVNYLSDKVSMQGAALKGYETTVKQLRDNAELRDNIALNDRNDSVANEMDRAEIIGDIGNEEENGNCSDVVHNTIKRVLRSDSSTSSD